MLRALVLIAILAAPVYAAEIETPLAMEGRDGDGPGYALARATQVIELVRTTRAIAVADWPGQSATSDLRVSLIVLDTGPATDVSPRVELHLALFNEIAEYGTTWALMPLTGAYRFDEVRRTAPGIYEIRAVLRSGRDGPDCSFSDALVTVDARALSVDVRRATGLGAFDIRRETTPVSLNAQSLGCAASPY